MGLRNKIAHAIAMVGCKLTVTGNDNEITVTASLQPDISRDRHIAEPVGYGFVCRYTMYVVWSNQAAFIETGWKVKYRDKLFLVEHISDYMLAGENIYRKAKLVLLDIAI